MNADTKDDLGSELPGEVWHTAMRFTGLAAAREIVRLRWANENLSRIIEGMRLQFDATVDELRAERDRAERLCQEQATQAVDRSTMPTVPPRVGYRYERRDGSTCRIVKDFGAGRVYRYQCDDGRTYAPSGKWGCFDTPDPFDLVREIGPSEGDAK